MHCVMKDVNTFKDEINETCVYLLFQTQADLACVWEAKKFVSFAEKKKVVFYRKPAKMTP